MNRCKKTKYKGLPREVEIDDLDDLAYILNTYPQHNITTRYICTICGRRVSKDIRSLRLNPYLLCRTHMLIHNCGISNNFKKKKSYIKETPDTTLPLPLVDSAGLNR